MSELPAAFYDPDGDLLHPTALCIGPWSAELQHGGPPSSLLARAIRKVSSDDRQLSRLSVDLLRPIPLRPLRAIATVTRAGRRATWTHAELRDADGALLARATGVSIRRTSLDLPPLPSEPAPAPPPADGVEPFVFPFFPAPIAYHRGVQVQIVDGRWPFTPCTAWMALTAPLIAGEPTDPTDALIALADACNGLSPAVPDLRASFVNADLTVNLARQPEGSVFAFAARSLADPTGSGLGQATLYDHRGEVGRSLQSLVIDLRG